ncbi:site-specific DNA-methyltransferase [Pseudomonas moraviensis]|uniref:DNA-methyltransferase n=1 Tax=Pseudomonas moraviensis TaxID=321662 RepID=UPI0018D77832|nr:DNA methyltransferase [Pseudomonas moraviensis]MBH3442226.1 site-specific DNA-methyltransferase [Pseudomonas moraviensis]
MTRIAPGCIRDSIFDFLSTTDSAPVKEIHNAVETRLGSVAQSSVRSYLNLNVPGVFERVKRGRYRLAGRSSSQIELLKEKPIFTFEKSTLVSSDCFDWLRDQPAKSIHAVVTDPPYGLVEYTSAELTKLRSGKGGVWRIPPAFDGHQRAPLPRFTVLTDSDRAAMHVFFLDLGRHLARVVVPGANIVIASNPLLAHIVASAMSEAGLELRGYISRLVMTMRGGDRPKNAHEEFSDVSVMPRSMHEPWVVLRAPLEGRVQDNLRKWGTGGFRRFSEDKPFGDVIRSHPTPATEKRLAPHPSLKPQGFLRQLVRASLPLGEGIVYDPFAGSGSTLAAANAVGYQSVGTERDDSYFELASVAIPQLTKLKVKDVDTL